MYCNRCGASLDDDALVCPDCGHQVPASVEPTEETVSEMPESAEQEPGAGRLRVGGCGWAMTAGMLAGCAILVVLSLAAVAIWQGVQERTRLNHAASMEHYQKGLTQLALENLQLAGAEFELAVGLDSKNMDAVARLAEVDALLSSLPTPTSGVSRQTAVLLYNEARDLHNRGEWEGVISKLEQVRTLDPYLEREQVAALLADAYYRAALRLAEEDRMEEAVRYLSRALEMRPAEQEVREQKRWASLYLAGLGYWGADWQGAIESFRVLYQLKPDYKDTRERLYDAYVAYADALYEKGEWCAARDRYDSALHIELEEQIKAKRDDAAQRCAVTPVPEGTPPPSGTFVGRVVEVEDVGQEKAMMIRGHVLDAAGNPVVGVQVALSAWDWSAPPALTNADGVFAFDGLGNPVTYSVTLVNMPAVPLPVKTDWGKLVWVEFRAQP